MKRRRGFSLADILMAMAFFSTLLVMALGILFWALRGSQAQESNTRAAFLAQSKMEELFAASKPTSEAGQFGGRQSDFSWRTEVTPLEEKDFLQLSVIVSGPRGCFFRLNSQRRLSHRELLFSSDKSLLHTSEDYREHETFPASIGGSGSFSLAPDGLTLAYVDSDQGKGQIFTRRLGSKDPGTLLFEHPQGASEPCYSPDGRRLAFVSQDNGFSQVFVVDLKSKLYENKSRSSHHDGSPSWAPDGKGLVVCRDGSSLFLLTDGGEKALVEESSGWNTMGSFDPSGKLLAFMSNRDGNPEIYLKSMTTGKITRLTDSEAYDSHPRFSNDGKRIVFLSDRQDHTNRLYSMNCDGSQLELLTPKNAVSEGMWLP